jgi:hypothetical protein
MLYRANITVGSETNTRHLNTLCGQNAEFFNVKPVGASNNQQALKG